MIWIPKRSKLLEERLVQFEGTVLLVSHRPGLSE